MSITARDWRLGSAIIAGCFFAGTVIWMASFRLLGEREPWDADGRFYVGILFVTGLVAGTIAPRWIWAAWAGTYLGQFVGCIIVNPRLGPLAPLGLLCFLPVSSLIALFGAAIGAVLRMIAERTTRKDAKRQPD